jgi:PST family polysaccharide transporter
MRSVAMIFLALGLLGIQQIAFDSAYGFDLFALTLFILALRGFENLTLKQYARQYDFRPDGILMSGAQIVWTVGSVAAALLTHSYAAMFWGQLASVIWIAGYSNWVAPDRFDLDWNPKVAQEALRFGAPLVPNGLVSAVSSSDRFLIGSFLGARPVAVYSVAISLATLPRSILYRVATSVLVSHFTNISSDSTKFRAFYHQWIALVAALATVYALAIILLGDAVIRLAFGAAYVPSSLLISLIAIVVFIKFMFLVPVPTAYALGETKFVLLGSALSAVSVVPAALLLLLGMRSLEAFILAVVAIETIGLMVYINLTAKRHQLRRPLVFAMVILPLIGLSLLACSALFHRVA